MSEAEQLLGPDLTKGVPLSDLPDGGSLVGHCGSENVLVVRRGGDLFAVSNRCSHYGGPLSEGLVVDDTVRCPWHHACFSLRTGEALSAPAFQPIATWDVGILEGRIFVRSPREQHRSSKPVSTPESVVIIGSGAAGHMAAETLRREGYDRPVTIVSSDSSIPYDRPNLSKDFLAGTAPEEWIPLRGEEFYRDNAIELRLGQRVTHVDAAKRLVRLAEGGEVKYGALLIATGSEPIQLNIQGSSNVAYLRSLSDSRLIIARAGNAKRAVVLGASFIGLEVAAALRTRGLSVTVVAPDELPLARVLGTEIGRFIRSLHEDHGVRFRLGETAREIRPSSVVLSGGEELPADLVVAGIGVRPSVAVALSSGAKVDGGVLVDEYLQTTVPDIFAAGDIARWPDPHSGERIRVEHWAVAQRQGQTAAWNILGLRRKFDAVPFFWSAHYDVAIDVVGHASSWDRAAVIGDIGARDARVDYVRDGRVVATATLFRDRESLEVEAQMERRARAGAMHG